MKIRAECSLQRLLILSVLTLTISLRLDEMMFDAPLNDSPASNKPREQPRKNLYKEYLKTKEGCLKGLGNVDTGAPNADTQSDRKSRTKMAYDLAICFLEQGGNQSTPSDKSLDMITTCANLVWGDDAEYESKEIITGVWNCFQDKKSTDRPGEKNIQQSGESYGLENWRLNKAIEDLNSNDREITSQKHPLDMKPLAHINIDRSGFLKKSQSTQIRSQGDLDDIKETYKGPKIPKRDGKVVVESSKEMPKIPSQNKPSFLPKTGNDGDNKQSQRSTTDDLLINEAINQPPDVQLFSLRSKRMADDQPSQSVSMAKKNEIKLPTTKPLKNASIKSSENKSSNASSTLKPKMDKIKNKITEKEPDKKPSKKISTNPPSSPPSLSLKAKNEGIESDTGSLDKASLKKSEKSSSLKSTGSQPDIDKSKGKPGMETSIKSPPKTKIDQPSRASSLSLGAKNENKPTATVSIDETSSKKSDKLSSVASSASKATSEKSKNKPSDAGFDKKPSGETSTGRPSRQPSPSLKKMNESKSTTAESIAKTSSKKNKNSPSRTSSEPKDKIGTGKTKPSEDKAEIEPIKKTSDDKLSSLKSSSIKATNESKLTAAGSTDKESPIKMENLVSGSSSESKASKDKKNNNPSEAWPDKNPSKQKTSDLKPEGINVEQKKDHRDMPKTVDSRIIEQKDQSFLVQSGEPEIQLQINQRIKGLGQTSILSKGQLFQNVEMPDDQPIILPPHFIRSNYYSLRPFPQIIQKSLVTQFQPPEFIPNDLYKNVSSENQIRYLNNQSQPKVIIVDQNQPDILVDKYQTNNQEYLMNPYAWEHRYRPVYSHYHIQPVYRALPYQHGYSDYQTKPGYYVPPNQFEYSRYQNHIGSVSYRNHADYHGYIYPRYYPTYQVPPFFRRYQNQVDDSRYLSPATSYWPESTYGYPRQSPSQRSRIIIEHGI